MSIKTTRRGLFAFAAAVVGTSTLAAAKPAEAPASEAGLPTPEDWARADLAVAQFHYRLIVKAELEKADLDPSLWDVEFGYDFHSAGEVVTLSSRAYGDRVLYSAVRLIGPENLTQELAQSQVEAMAMNVEHIEEER